MLVAAREASCEVGDTRAGSVFHRGREGDERTRHVGMHQRLADRLPIDALGDSRMVEGVERVERDVERDVTTSLEPELGREHRSEQLGRRVRHLPWVVGRPDEPTIELEARVAEQVADGSGRRRPQVTFVGERVEYDDADLDGLRRPLGDRVVALSQTCRLSGAVGHVCAGGRDLDEGAATGEGHEVARREPGKPSGWSDERTVLEERGAVSVLVVVVGEHQLERAEPVDQRKSPGKAEILIDCDEVGCVDDRVVGDLLGRHPVRENSGVDPQVESHRARKRASHQTQRFVADRLLVGVVHLANVAQRPVIAVPRARCALNGGLSPTATSVLVTLASPLSRRDPTRRRDKMSNSEPEANAGTGVRPGATVETRDAGAPADRSWPDVIDLRDGADRPEPVGVLDPVETTGPIDLSELPPPPDLDLHVIDELPAWRAADGSYVAPDTRDEATAEVATSADVEVTALVVRSSVDRVLAITPPWAYASEPRWEPEPVAKWRTPQLVASIFASLLLGAGLGFAVGHRDGGGAATDRQGRVASGTVAAASAASAGPAPGASVAPSSRIATPSSLAAAPTSGPGTYREPLAVGAHGTLRDLERGDLDVVVDAVEGDPWARITAANAFNTNAPNGLRYVMVTITVTYRAGSKQTTFDGISGALAFSAFGSAAREHRDAEYPVVVPAPIDRFADLLDGGTITGNLVFVVEADSPSVSLRVQGTTCSAACREVWFALS